jgi:hypothetical protein
MLDSLGKPVDSDRKVLQFKGMELETRLNWAKSFRPKDRGRNGLVVTWDQKD